MNSIQQKLLKQLREELGTYENTEHLIDWLEDAWETFDLLQERFGATKALQIYTAHVSLPKEEKRTLLRENSSASSPMLLNGSSLC